MFFFSTEKVGRCVFVGFKALQFRRPHPFMAGFVGATFTIGSASAALSRRRKEQKYDNATLARKLKAKQDGWLAVGGWTATSAVTGGKPITDPWKNGI